MRFLWSKGTTISTSPNLLDNNSYYPQQATCQIPHLYWLMARFLGEKSDGYFVEVGAYDGVFVSNSWGLAAAGWAGLLIEPVPDFAQSCRENHSQHPMVEVVETAIGETANGEIELALAGTLTTANSVLEQEYGKVSWAAGAVSGATVKVACAGLDQVLERHNAPSGFDVLIIDVEGFEAEVFRSFSLEAWRPKMIIVELADTHPDLSSTAVSDAQTGTMLTDSGYTIIYKDHINTVFIAKEVHSAAVSSWSV